MKTAESKNERDPDFFARSRTPLVGVEHGKNWVELVIIALLFFFSFWLMFHTFGYDQKTRSIQIASRLWSDFGAHIPLIRSFSMGANIDRMVRLEAPDYPIYAGEPIRKHFLFYALVGTLEKVGLRIDWALNIPSTAGFFGLLVGIYILAHTLFKSRLVGVLSVIFFLFNGSLSFIRFFTDHPLGRDTLQAITKIREFPSFGPWGPGDISAFWNLNIYTNQRHLAAGFAIGVWFLIWVLKKSTEPWKNNIVGGVFWGIVIGLLPYFHQPMLPIMAILIAWNFIMFSQMRKPLLITGGVSLILIAPQLLTMPQSDALAWYVGYFIHDELSLPRFAWYWFQNLGLHAILIILGFFFLPKTAQKILAPLFFIFILANLFRVSIEIAASHKFFNFALVLGNLISAYVIFRLATIKRVPMILANIFCLALVGVLTLSGLIDFFVVRNDVRGSIADVASDPRANWIAEHTPKNAVILNSSFLYHPASIAGRSIFLGWPYFAWSEGYKGNRHELMKTIYESKDPAIFCPLLAEYKITHVTVEDTNNDPNLPVIDVDYFTQNFTPDYNSGGYAILSASDLCSGFQ